jgi:hypothetical protein
MYEACQAIRTLTRPASAAARDGLHCDARRQTCDNRSMSVRWWLRAIRPLFHSVSSSSGSWVSKFPHTVRDCERVPPLTRWIPDHGRA